MFYYSFVIKILFYVKFTTCRNNEISYTLEVHNYNARILFSFKAFVRNNVHSHRLNVAYAMVDFYK